MRMAGTRAAWPGDAPHGQYRRTVGQGEVGLAVAHAHEQRQVPVGAQCRHAQLAQVMAIRRLAAVHQADEGFTAHISGARAIAALIAGQHTRLAAHAVIRLVAAIARRIAHRIERQERLLRTGAMASNAAQGVNLEIHRPRTVGDHVVFIDPVGQMDAVHALGEQVDGGRAERQELRRADTAFQARFVAVEQHDQFQLLAVTPFDRTAQLGELNEQEAMGQGEVLLQQAIALERPRYHRHGRIGIIEPPRAQRALGQALDPIATGLARKHRAGVAQ